MGRYVTGSKTSDVFGQNLSAKTDLVPIFQRLLANIYDVYYVLAQRLDCFGKHAPWTMLTH